MARGDDLQTQRKQAYNVLISLCVTYTICIFLMRVWIRRKQYGPDDLVALAAMVNSDKSGVKQRSDEDARKIS